MSIHCEKCGQAKYLANLCRGLENENEKLRAEIESEREAGRVVREALKEAKLITENHTGLNSKAVILRVYDSAREALAQADKIRSGK